MMIEQALSPEQALAEIYRLTPQMKVYDQFISDLRWLPYTMFFHPSNFRSSVVNTDALGFRLSPWSGRNVSTAELPVDGRPVNLLVGGSNVLGTGALTDAGTTSAYLSELTGEPWLNFGARGYNALQEAMLFMMHRHRLRNVKHVVVLSGMNTLTLEGLPDELATDHGRYYYSYEYAHYMGLYSADLLEAAAEKSGWLEGFKNWLSNVNAGHASAASVVLDDRDSSTEERVVRAATEIVNALELWTRLLANTDTKLTFLLQPLSQWTRDSLSPSEKEIFNAIDSCPNNFWRLFGKILAKEVHAPFVSEIAKGCAQLNVDFDDMNALLARSPRLHDDLFVDRVHCNNDGYLEIARQIQSCCLQKPLHQHQDHTR
ncbi:MAG TPA: SGNH/GDSL hydrolase family protein [Limnobacter sp.]|nr:SGNH/GDSL hydrolase family protein [Limnobacter sp.]